MYIVYTGQSIINSDVLSPDTCGCVVWFKKVVSLFDHFECICM